MAALRANLTFLVIGADAALRERLGAVSFSGRVVQLDAAVARKSAGAVVLLPFPRAARFAPLLPTGLPFIALGAADQLGRAFDLGAADFLRDPWTDDELLRRAARLGGDELTVPDAGLRVARGWLYGPGGAEALSAAENFLLAELARDIGRRVSRAALHAFLQNGRAGGSRAVDVLVSRLRTRLNRVAGTGPVLQIRSARGFGYFSAIADVL